MRANNIMIVYLVFVVLAELMHISLDGPPPMYMRIGYIAIHLVFCALNVRLIPAFVSVSMIVQNFSAVFGEFLPATMYLNIALMCYCYLLMRYLKLGDRDHRIDGRAEYVIMLLFAVYAFLNFFILPNFSFLSGILFSIIFLACIRRLDDEHLRILVRYIIVAMALSSVLSLLNMDNLIEDYATSLGDVQRLAWNDSNYTSFFIGIIILISLFYASRTSSWITRNVYYVIVVILVVCMGLLISRGSIIALAIALLFYFRKSIFSVKIIKYGLLLGVVGFILYTTGLLDDIITRFHDSDMEDGSGRTIIWSVGLHTFMTQGLFTNIFGGGVGFADQTAFIGGIYYSPHNNFLEILYNFGFIGLTIFILWWISLYAGSSKEKKALVIFIMVNSLTICPLTYVQPIWIIIPLIMIWDRRINRLVH